MAVNITVDDKLVEEARRLGQHETDQEAVAAALDEYVKRRNQLKILDLAGTIDYDPDYDYKAGRRGKPR